MAMKKWLKKLLKKEWKPERVYDMQQHTGWGNSIQWTDVKTRKICGWLRNKPEKGDAIISKMESGRTFLFKVKDVKHCGDPHDMFFATVEDVRYLEEGEEIKGNMQSQYSRL